MQTDILRTEKRQKNPQNRKKSKSRRIPDGKKEPENVEMKLWAVGKDQAETGSLKDLLDGSDEELEEWKD